MIAVPSFISNYSKELLANTREFCCESPCLILVKRCCSERDLNTWKNTWLYSNTWFAGQKIIKLQREHKYAYVGRERRGKRASQNIVWNSLTTDGSQCARLPIPLRHRCHPSCAAKDLA